MAIYYDNILWDMSAIRAPYEVNDFKQFFAGHFDNLSSSKITPSDLKEIIASILRSGLLKNENKRENIVLSRELLSQIGVPVKSFHPACKTRGTFYFIFLMECVNAARLFNDFVKQKEKGSGISFDELLENKRRELYLLALCRECLKEHKRFCQENEKTIYFIERVELFIELGISHLCDEIEILSDQQLSSSDQKREAGEQSSSQSAASFFRPYQPPSNASSSAASFDVEESKHGQPKEEFQRRVIC